jgi:hypothetical protein
MLESASASIPWHAEVLMRRRFLLPFLLVFAIVLAGCGAGAPVQPSTEPTTSTGDVFQVALPRLVVDVDKDGNPSVLGINPAVLTALGVDTSAMKVPPATVEQMTKGGVQHLEIASVGDRIMLAANGKPLPHLGWTAESLPRVLDLASAFTDVQNAEMIRRLLPLVTRLGLDVVLRFPKGDAAEIPLPDPNVLKQYKPTPSTEAAGMIVKIPLSFDEQGRAGITGFLTPDDMSAMGMQGFSLPPETLKKIQAQNIQSLELQTRPEGAFIYVNNDPLPTLIWDPQMLKDTMDTIKQIAPDSALLPVLELLLPYMDRGDVDVMVRFPVAAGQTPIPAKMHE